MRELGNRRSLTPESSKPVNIAPVVSRKFDGAMVVMNNPDFLDDISVCLINVRKSAMCLIIFGILSAVK